MKTCTVCMDAGTKSGMNLFLVREMRFEVGGSGPQPSMTPVDSCFRGDVARDHPELGEVECQSGLGPSDPREPRDQDPNPAVPGCPLTSWIHCGAWTAG